MIGRCIRLGGETIALSATHRYPTETMDLNETLAFVAVARAASFTEAGRRLALPKGTVSRRVSRLEARLGARLLQRTSRHVALTEIGRAYYDRCAHAVEAIEDAERLASDVSKTITGTLRVSTSVDFARDWLAAWLPELHRRHPELGIEIEASQRRVDLVAEGFDLAIRAGTRLDDSGLVARKLADSALVLCAAPSYLARRAAPRSLRDLAKHACLTLARPRGAPPWKLRGPRGEDEAALSAWLVANDFGVLLAATRDGLGIGLLEEWSVKDDLARGRLVRVLPSYGIEGGGLFALYPSSHHLSPKVRAFVDFLAEMVAKKTDRSARGRPSAQGSQR